MLSSPTHNAHSQKNNYYPSFIPYHTPSHIISSPLKNINQENHTSTLSSNSTEKWILEHAHISTFRTSTPILNPLEISKNASNIYKKTAILSPIGAKKNKKYHGRIYIKSPHPKKNLYQTFLLTSPEITASTLKKSNTQPISILNQQKSHMSPNTSPHHSLSPKCCTLM